MSASLGPIDPALEIREARHGAVVALLALALAAAALIALGAATPAHADAIHRSYVYQGAKYKIEADYNDDDDDGPRGWYLEAEYRGPVNKKKTSYTIPKSFKITYKGKKRTVHVKEIGDKAFYKLTKVKLEGSDGDVHLSANAFRNCGKLKAIEGLGKLESLNLRANSLEGTPLSGKVTGFNRNPFIEALGPPLRFRSCEEVAFGRLPCV